MQIILIHPKWVSPKTYDMSTRSFVAFGVLTFLLSMLIALGLYGLTLKYAAQIPVPFLREAFMNVAIAEQKRQDTVVRENINTMAQQLGEIKSQITRLEALGERVSGLAGVKNEFDFKTPPGRGGLALDSSELKIGQLLTLLEGTHKLVNKRSDQLNVLETELMSQQIKLRSIPTSQPVAGIKGSGYGYRLDPFNGTSSMHEGIDFMAPGGTPILAAAGGVVSVAEWHPGYGNLVEVDHGNNLITRYAHASKVLVKAGDLVKMGQKIAEVGSTGRSTGPHLHFEVLVNGIAQNPVKFLGQTETAAGTTGK